MLVAAALVVALLVPGSPAAAQTPEPRIGLRVLVVTDGLPEVEAIRMYLLGAGVPVETVDLRDPDRRRLDSGFLSDDGRPGSRAHFQGVVLPDEYPGGLADEEMAALHDFEREYGIRQITASAPAGPAVGLDRPGFTGPFDGRDARFTPAARDDFGYARGHLPFEDPNPGSTDTWIEIARPRAGFEPFLTATSPDGVSGAVGGVFAQDGREELVLTFTYHSGSPQFQVLAPGLLSWLTDGVYLGSERAWFSVHIDDVLLPNARWVPDADCTAGVDCPASVPDQPLIRMTAADVDHAVRWQRENGLRIDLAFNGSGSSVGGASGPDPLTEALIANKDEFGWISHTWTHLYLGCVRDHGPEPWACATLPLLGWTRFVSQARIEQEVELNLDFARRHALPLDPTELVTGEHGGLRARPQMPEDNPNLAPAMTATGVLTLAADTSEEHDHRMVGSATTLPRYPINLDYSAATELETVDHYNWKNTTRADGGSGSCELDGGCIRPVDPQTGFDGYVVPAEGRLALSHVLGNDPRSHYVHQSQLTEDRTIFPVLEYVLTAYRDLVDESRPLLVPTMTEARNALVRHGVWDSAVAEGRVQAWREGDVVTVVTTSPTDVPLTTRPGTRTGTPTGPEFGEAYGGTRSAWPRIDGTQQFVIDERDPG